MLLLCEGTIKGKRKKEKGKEDEGTVIRILKGKTAKPYDSRSKATKFREAEAILHDNNQKLGINRYNDKTLYL